MQFISRKSKFYFLAFLKHDFKASITVFFVALPLCLGISLASGVPVYSGLAAGIVGGIIVSLISKSPLSVSGPAAGLTAICAAAIHETGGLPLLFLAIMLAGLMQILLGIFKLGGFTSFIPSAVIKGMLAAIGIILISKQIPFVLFGYDKPMFWSNELFNIITFNHAFQNIDNIRNSFSAGILIVSISSILFLIVWKRWLYKLISFLPASFITVVFGVMISLGIQYFFPSIKLLPSHFVNVPKNVFSHVNFPDFKAILHSTAIWKNAIVICFVATLETLLSIEAIDKLDASNRVTPQNRELIAQGVGNTISGLIGGLPVTAVIVRSAANAEAKAKTKLSSFSHGLWILLVVLFAVGLVNMIPYCVLAVILIRTGYNLAKPSMILSVYKQGREQFLPFIITVIAILITNLLIGVLIGLAYSIYFLAKHTYRAGYTLQKIKHGHYNEFIIELAMNVSFLNKKKLIDELDKIPMYSVVEIIGTNSVYIDYDILEIFQQFKLKAHLKHIELKLIDIREVETIEVH